MQTFEAAILAGKKRKESPKEDFINDALDLLAEITC